jgi:hypothetical protein
VLDGGRVVGSCGVMRVTRGHRSRWRLDELNPQPSIGGGPLSGKNVALTLEFINSARDCAKAARSRMTPAREPPAVTGPERS